jgi:hypothetical protein
MDPSVKVCNKCHRLKSIKQFNKDASKTDGLQRNCRRCTRKKDSEYASAHRQKLRDKSLKYYRNNLEDRRAYAKRYRDENKHRMRLNNYKQHYDFTPEQIAYLMAWENGSCASCGKPLMKIGLGSNHGCSDHDHTSGKFRSVLCHHCNRLIGLAKEDVQILLGCISYLRQWAKNEDWLDFANPKVLAKIQQKTIKKRRTP